MRGLHYLLAVVLLTAFAAAEPEGPSLEKKAWLDGYSGQSTAALLDLASKYRPDSVVVAFDQALQQKSVKAKLSPEERVVVVVEALESEVNNGGFLQFFQNTSAEYALEAPESLEQIKCPQCARLAKQALALLTLPASPTADDIQTAAEQTDEDRDEKLDHLDQEYYRTVGDLSLPLLAYIREHQDTIILP